MCHLVRWSGCVLLALHVLAPSHAPAYNVTLTESIPDLQGFVIEDFEDAHLIPALSYLDPVTAIELNTLPNLFERPGDAWDGVHALSNFAENTGVSSNSDVGPLKILIAGGAHSVAFGMSNLQFPEDGPT